VWSLLKHSSHKSMSLQATLCGHAGEVLCLDLAPQIGNLLSGGADRVAILWDLRDFTAVRLLLGHTSPVTSVSINKRTGDMVTLAGVDMRIWSISGTRRGGAGK
jgi:WD40 repeat protein